MSWEFPPDDGRDLDPGCLRFYSLTLVDSINSFNWCVSFSWHRVDIILPAFLVLGPVGTEFFLFNGKGLIIYYDGDCGFCWKSVQLVKTFVLCTRIDTLPAQSNPEMQAAMQRNNSWIVIDELGQSFLGYLGFVAIVGSCKFSAWLGPILTLTPIQRIGERMYGFVAAHRSVSCQLPSTESTNWGKRVQLTTQTSILALVMTVYVVIWNLGNLNALPFKLSDRFRSVGNIVELDQTWEMFAPFPAKNDGWYVIPGSLKDGRRVDLYRGGAEID